MSVQFKPNKKMEKDYDYRTYIMIQGYKQGRADLANNWVDLRDYDKEMAKQGEQ